MLRSGARGRVLSLSSAKSRKDRKRQQRRLGDLGVRSYESARTPAEVARACEAFLALEGKGWKGRRGTALVADPAHATFARSMTRTMAENGRCRIDALLVGNRPAAMGIVLTDGAERAYFWKTTFDPDLAPLSPGVQFALDLADAQMAERGVVFTDSCAVPDHPMINKLWPDRIEMRDVAIALRPGRPRAFTIGVALERLRRDGRACAKAVRARLKRAASKRGGIDMSPARSDV